MDYARSFTFVFDDPDWVQKIGIGAALVLISTLLSSVLIGVLGFIILAGYTIRLLQNVRDGIVTPLPEWDDWGGDFMRGLKYVVVALVWALPLILFSIPVGIGSAISGGGDAAEFLGVSILICGTCLMVLYGIFVALATPGYSIAYATDERISSGLQFTEIWQWTQAHLSQVIVAVIVIILVQLAISIVAGIAGAILCIVGLVITLPLGALATYLYQFHLYGQLSHEYAYGGLGGPTGTVPGEPAAPVVTSPTEGTEPTVESPAEESTDEGTDEESRPE